MNKTVSPVLTEGIKEAKYPANPCGLIHSRRYENMSVQYAAISKSGKNDNFLMKNFDIVYYFCSKHRL